jgi:cyclase
MMPTSMTLTRRKMMGLLAAIPATIALERFPQVVHADGPPSAEEPPRDPGFATNPVKITELSPGISVLMGPGGNITVLNAGEGSLMIDSGIPSRSADVIAGATKAAGNAIPRTLINTHWHFDHTGGNAALAQAGVRAIIAHDNTLARLSSPQHIAFMGLDFPAADVTARPSLTFTDSMTIHRGDEDVRLLYFAPAHTDTDIAAFFRGANVLSTGDLFFNGFYPFIDYSTRGSLDGMIAASDRMLTFVDDKTKIVPGHGPVGDKGDLISFRGMLVAARDRLKPLIASGASLADVEGEKPLADLDAKWGQRMFHSTNFVHCVYAGETAGKS